MKQEPTTRPPQAPPDMQHGARSGRESLRTSRSLGVHLYRQMRGRYRWLALAVIGGVVLGAVLGFFSTEPIYRTVALVEVGPPPGIVGPSHGKDIESFNDLQVALMLGQRVATQALRSSHWLKLDVHERPPNVAALIRRLEARPLAGEPMQILVSHADADARVARIAARSVVESFEQVTIERHRAERSLKAKHIREKLETLREQMDSIQSRIRQATSTLGPIPISTVYASKVDESQHLESLLQSTRMALDAIRTDDHADLGPEQTAQILARLARADTKLGKWLGRRQQVERKLTKLRRHMGVNAPALVDTRNDLRWIDRQIHDSVHSMGTEPDTPAGDGPADSGATVTLSINDLRRRETHLRRRYEQSRLRVTELEDVRVKVEALEKLASDHRVEIDQEQSRLEQCETTSRTGPQINVLSYGEPQPPGAPYRDRRRVIATLLAFTGGTVGLCLVLLVTALDDRMLRPDNAALDGPAAPLLGTVPGVSNHGADPKESDLAALCIHEIRALLQVRAMTNGSKAFAITSPSRGAGTTSLTAGLASSLALSGTRTLLIDCDLAGRVQSNPHGAGRRDHAGAGADSDRGEPAPAASVDQVMLQMGYLNEQDASIFLNPRDTETGLLGVLSGAPLERCVIQTNLPDLWILPALCARSQDIGKMSSKFIRGLIDQAKSMVDIILFDTGPIPGSVESLFVTSVADAVILVVRRGESQSRFNRSVSYLRMVGAEVAGTVFNGAARQSLSLQSASGADEPDAAGRRPTRRRELTAGSGILLAAVQDQSADPIGETRTAEQAVEHDLAERAATATQTDQPNDASTRRAGASDVKPRYAGKNADQDAGQRANQRADQHGDPRADVPAADAAERELDEQIRRLLADAS